MKTLLVTVILALTMISACFAANDTILAEEETETAVSYIIAGETTPPFIRKFFVKYINQNNESEYWLRISYIKTDRLKPYIDIEIKGEKFRVWAFEEYKKRHLHAGESTKLEFHTDKSFEVFPLSSDIVQKIVDKKDLTIVLPSRKRAGMVLKSNEYFINGIKEIVLLRYEDREDYYTNNKKVEISQK